MKHTAPLTSLLAASTLALALSGCTADTPSGPVASESAQPTTVATTAATGEPTTTAIGEPIAAEHNDADVLFAQKMIPHHKQAVDMSETLLAKADIPADVRDFAQKVIDAQGPEIARMEQMLQTWQQPLPTSDSPGRGHGSGGMMSQDDLHLLAGAQGTEAARLYLEQMTTHHQGAVDMAREEVSAGRNPQTISLAEAVISAQEAEIQQMRTMLAGLPPRG